MASRWTESLGLALSGHGGPVPAVAWARAAERAGFGSVWISEDYYHPGAFALAGAVAAVTDRAVVGLGVVNPYTRHPALLAMEAAALAGIAPERIILGLGTSNRNWIEGQMRMPFATPLQALRECVEIVRRLLAGERLSFHGECFALHNVQLEWVPTARAVPLLLGVKGPKALRLAAEIADGVHGAVLTSPHHVRRIRATADETRERLGREFTVVAYVPVGVHENGHTARQSVKPLLAHYLGVLHGQSILRDAGYGPEQTKSFADALRQGAPAMDLVTDAMVDTLAIAGTPDDCCSALGRLADAGLDVPIALVPGEAEVTRHLALIGETLVPCWRDLRCR
jgi:5,10-methylenetetrahydromethanopterin reductase